MATLLPLGCRCRVYSLGSITAADINAGAAAASITITLSGSGIPTGYAISAVWLNTIEAFSGSRNILPGTVFLRTSSPSEEISGTLYEYSAIFQTLGAKVHITPNEVTASAKGLNEMGVDNYVNGIVVGITFQGGTNPQDYIAGELEILLELTKSPV